MTEKEVIRATIRQKRRALDPAQKRELDQAVLHNLLSLPELSPETGRWVYCYVSIGGEVDTRNLLKELWQRKIPVAVPKVEGNLIRFYRVRGMEDLEPGCMGIPEPVAGSEPADCPEAVVITPGLAFTPEGGRIGYGGGYYDRFFKEVPCYRRIAAAYPFQILPQLPTEPFDMRVDAIVTGERIYKCKRRTEHGTDRDRQTR